MPVLPEEALQKLICSCCKKYLSVFPVKVYPNKNVKCGRCEDNNGGTTSRLYELVAKQLEFPCVNRFEGCKELLLAPHMEQHETTCYSDEYACPLCSDFNGNIGNSESGLEDEKGVTIELLRHKYPKNMIFCKFLIWVPAVILDNYRYNKVHCNVQCDLPHLTDGSRERALLRFKFDNISSMKVNEYKYSNFKYFVGDILWVLQIKKIIEGEKTFLSVYLAQDKKHQKTCKVKNTTTLISSKSQENFSVSYVKDKFPTCCFGHRKFINWDHLFSPENKFVKEDSIEFQILLEVLPCEEVKWHKCQKACVTCNGDDSS